jgi:hypothetical protein
MPRRPAYDCRDSAHRVTLRGDIWAWNRFYAPCARPVIIALPYGNFATAASRASRRVSQAGRVRAGRQIRRVHSGTRPRERWRIR